MFFLALFAQWVIFTHCFFLTLTGAKLRVLLTFSQAGCHSDVPQNRHILLALVCAAKSSGARGFLSGEGIIISASAPYNSFPHSGHTMPIALNPMSSVSHSVLPHLHCLGICNGLGLPQSLQTTTSAFLIFTWDGSGT